MTLRKELQLFLICSASLLSTYAIADRPSARSAEPDSPATEYREKAAHKARIAEHRALAEGKRAARPREDRDDRDDDDSSDDDGSDDDNENAEEQQPEKAEG
jgi:hypothetical protein